MRKAAAPAIAPPAIAAVNAAHLAAFSEHLRSRPLHTRSAYLRDATVLAALAGDTDVARLRAPELRRFLATVHGRGLSGRSLARMLSSWRALYRQLQDRDPSIKEDPCAGLKAPKAMKRLPSALSPDEAAQLVDLESGEVRVWGKGSKERIVPVGASALAAIRGWLDKRAQVRDADPMAMFVGRGGKRITPRAIERRLAGWALRQGLTRHVHPHMLRHSFASHVLQSSGDLRAVQEMLGHASIASTQVYTHLDFQYLAKAYDRAHPRARRKKT
jgi:integrase/recombinase XerC